MDFNFSFCIDVKRKLCEKAFGKKTYITMIYMY